MNNMEVFVLMAGLTGLVVAIGQLIGGGTGAIMALMLSGATKLFMYCGSSTQFSPSVARHLDATDRTELAIQRRGRARTPEFSGARAGLEPRMPGSAACARQVQRFVRRRGAIGLPECATARVGRVPGKSSYSASCR